MATVIRWFAVVESGRLKLSGFSAKVMWAFLDVALPSRRGDEDS